MTSLHAAALQLNCDFSLLFRVCHASYFSRPWRGKKKEAETTRVRGYSQMPCIWIQGSVEWCHTSLFPRRGGQESGRRQGTPKRVSQSANTRNNEESRTTEEAKNACQRRGSQVQRTSRIRILCTNGTSLSTSILLNCTFIPSRNAFSPRPSREILHDTKALEACMHEKPQAQHFSMKVCPTSV